MNTPGLFSRIRLGRFPQITPSGILVKNGGFLDKRDFLIKKTPSATSWCAIITLTWIITHHSTAGRLFYILQREPLKCGELYHKTDEKARKKREIFEKTFTYFCYQKQSRICLISWDEAHKIREAGVLNFKFGPVSLLRSAFTCTTADTAMAKTPMCTRSDRIIPKIITCCQVKKG